MNKKKIPIKYSKERVVLSDVLPYETPLTFSNRYFYQFIANDKNRQIIENPKLKTENEQENKKIAITNQIIHKILFGNSKHNSPFYYKISHKEVDFRELAIIHPKNQYDVVKFYEKYKDLILYYSTISNFSIRKPHKVAKYVFFNDKLHKKNKDHNHEHNDVEQSDNEYENLKSFFSVKKYSNIHKFYESYQSHKCEKQYNYLLKFDISKCFDSIYTHTISWALLNKEIVKNNIEPSRYTFAGEFDELMQKLNANETNGIVIGPEFSRIFAELILQQIDKKVYETLKKDDSIVHQKDYEIFRYIDDFFVFYNDNLTKDKIIEAYKLNLKEYKLQLNNSKTEVYEKPIITNISIAKIKISDLFKEHLTLKIKDNKIVSNDVVSEESELGDDKGFTKTIYFTSNNVITRFKSIIKETNIAYKDILNYSLAALDRKTATIINSFNKLTDIEKKESIFLKAFLELLDVSFFLYSVSPKVNSSIKICLIIEKIITFLKKNKENNYTEPFNNNNKHLIFKKIADEIVAILHKNKSSKVTQVETLYLLIALSHLGREYRLTTKQLCHYFNINQDKDGEFTFENELNYFSITVLLFYVKNIQQYESIKNALKIHIEQKFKSSTKENWGGNTELVLLILDIISCPFLDNKVSPTKMNKLKLEQDDNKKKKLTRDILNEKYEFKKNLLTLCGISDNHTDIIEFQKYWFTKWTDFDFGKELAAKRSQEVYG